MRFSATILLAATLVAVNAQSVEYPTTFQPNGECVQACLDKIGKEVFTNWSLDPKSPYFIESLSFENEKGTPKYSNFMMKAGMCMTSCPKSEQDVYSAQFQAKNDWYMANKDTYGKSKDSKSGASKSVVSGLVGAAVAMSAIALI